MKLPPDAVDSSTCLLPEGLLARIARAASHAAPDPMGRECESPSTLRARERSSAVTPGEVAVDGGGLSDYEDTDEMTGDERPVEYSALDERWPGSDDRARRPTPPRPLADLPEVGPPVSPPHADKFFKVNLRVVEPVVDEPEHADACADAAFRAAVSCFGSEASASTR